MLTRDLILRRNIVLDEYDLNQKSVFYDSTDLDKLIREG